MMHLHLKTPADTRVVILTIRLMSGSLPVSSILIDERAQAVVVKPRGRRGYAAERARPASDGYQVDNAVVCMPALRFPQGAQEG